ncbi:hypothetical protein V8C42DRAFT_304655 [Trichoderma barbatum]
MSQTGLGSLFCCSGVLSYLPPLLLLVLSLSPDNLQASFGLLFLYCWGRMHTRTPTPSSTFFPSPVKNQNERRRIRQKGGWQCLYLFCICVYACVCLSLTSPRFIPCRSSCFPVESPSFHWTPFALLQ